MIYSSSYLFTKPLSQNNFSSSKNGTAQISFDLSYNVQYVYCSLEFRNFLMNKIVLAERFGDCIGVCSEYTFKKYEKQLSTEKTIHY
jgi:hypothetical protein